MNKSMVFIESTSNDPRFNLALEQYVFDRMPRENDYFILWQNHNTIVVGKHQNTLEEINPVYVKEHDITVVRRLSGGGAVYHDMGNVNFTFIADADNLEQLNLQAFCIPVVRMLNMAGVDAQISGRNDITIYGKKFSGNSQYIKEGRIMHHGTLMFDSDLSVVADALQVKADKYESKGFKSVKSRVTNIRPYLPQDMDITKFKQLLKKNMVRNQEMSVYQLAERDLEQIREIQKDRYDRWDWNYGKSPAFSVEKKRKIDGVGRLDVYMNVEHGCIQELEIFGDFFGEGATKELKMLLKGCELEEEKLSAKLRHFDLERCFSHLKTEDFIKMLTN